MATCEWSTAGATTPTVVPPGTVIAGSRTTRHALVLTDPVAHLTVIEGDPAQLEQLVERIAATVAVAPADQQ